MTHFGPTKGDIKFRLMLSLSGLVAILGAIIFRGMPVEESHVLVLFVASVFLGISAGMSVLKLNQFEETE